MHYECLPLRQERQDSLLQLLINTLDRLARVDYLEAVFFGHGVKLLKQARLIINKAIKEVFTEAHIHARFPVIEAAALQYTRYEVLDTYAQVEDSIRFQRQPINGANPTGIGTTYNGTSHEGINIAVGEYDKA